MTLSAKTSLILEEHKSGFRREGHNIIIIYNYGAVKQTPGRVPTAQGKQGKQGNLPKIFPVRENTGILEIQIEWVPCPGADSPKKQGR